MFCFFLLILEWNMTCIHEICNAELLHLHLIWSQDIKTSLSSLKQLFFWAFAGLWVKHLWFDSRIISLSSYHPKDQQTRKKKRKSKQLCGWWCVTVARSAAWKTTNNSKLTWKTSATLMILNLKEHPLFHSTKVTQMRTQ